LCLNRMAYSKHQTELGRFLTTEKNKVRAVYNRYRTAVQSDHYLLQYYRWMFGDPEGKEDVIKRKGRRLRQECREGECKHTDPSMCYIRSEENCIKAVEQEQVHRDYYGRH